MATTIDRSPTAPPTGAGGVGGEIDATGDADEPGARRGAVRRPAAVWLATLLLALVGALWSVAQPQYRAPDEAAHVLTDPDGRWGPSDGVRRRFTSEALSALVGGVGLVVEQLHGVRVVADLVPSAVLDTEPGAAASLLALERALSDRPPFRDVATQLHLLAVRR